MSNHRPAERQTLSNTATASSASDPNSANNSANCRRQCSSSEHTDDRQCTHGDVPANGIVHGDGQRGRLAPTGNVSLIVTAAPRSPSRSLRRPPRVHGNVDATSPPAGSHTLQANYAAQNGSRQQAEWNAARHFGPTGARRRVLVLLAIVLAIGAIRSAACDRGVARCDRLR